MADALTGLEGMNSYELIGNALNISPTSVLVLMVVVSIWALVWKGLALWKSSQKKSVPWFVVLLVLNTVGILEILYIFVFSKISLKGKSKGETVVTKTKTPEKKKTKKKK